eukprot:CAMPEP_0177701858 /NCGR_PEP_ID=MMETSP0484_2-20121128/6831_1 /TAXON_ID=354590 /ORGANISM="Rhodomonas lens, Strain RHODO" /LENGTH=324 /DNA_ID=CAMNT_0019213111 /DNA_START=177 /DNA_END=1148 /DNA_ORIENTATION=+
MSGRRICAAVLLAFCFCSVSDGTSIIELQSGVPSQGLLGREKQHYYFVNVSQAIGRNIRDPTSIASKRLSVTLRKGPSVSPEPLVLSLCLNTLPCGNLGCSCPARFVDAGTQGGQDNTLRGVDVSPCDLEAGIWYISVELPVPASQAVPDTSYILTAELQSSFVKLGSTVEDKVCCKQSQYFYTDLSELQDGNELRVQLLSDDRLRDQSPLRLSVSYEACSDDEPWNRLDPSMGQILTLPPDRLVPGRLYLGVHATDARGARFILNVSYRPELKSIVVIFLVTVVLLVFGTIGAVCFIKIRKRLSKHKELQGQLTERKQALRMA